MCAVNAITGPRLREETQKVIRRWKKESRAEGCGPGCFMTTNVHRWHLVEVRGQEGKGFGEGGAASSDSRDLAQENGCKPTRVRISGVAH